MHCSWLAFGSAYASISAACGCEKLIFAGIPIKSETYFEPFRITDARSKCFRTLTYNDMEEYLLSN